jgi:glycosyltransferase involved in cell wall biosynthesis
MRILQVHNFYQQAGGEDRVVAAENAMLTSRGHIVTQYTVHNDAVNSMRSIELCIKTLWNNESYRHVQHIIRDRNIELVHVHNTLPLISPAVYYAAARLRIPVVQTLHNFRLLCPAATLYRDGEICELCLRKTIKYPAVMHRCYRGSVAGSATVAAMLAMHGFAGTHSRKIQAYIALSEFAKNKFSEGGLPEERIVVKPNFLADDPGPGNGSGGYALFAGRLAPEKGLGFLLDAWKYWPNALPLKIAGDGPLQSMVKERAAALANVEYLGVCEHSRVLEMLKEAAFLVLPSRWYEGMPMVAIEAMACGTPLVGYAVGSLNDLILNEVNGVKLPFEGTHILEGFLRDSGNLTEKMAALRPKTRTYFERYFTADVNYPILLDIYDKAVISSHSLS